MLLNGNFIFKNNHSGEFIFWGQNGSTEYKRRGRGKSGSLAIYPGLAKPEEVLKVLDCAGIDADSAGETASAVVYRPEAGKQTEGSDCRIFPYEIKGISHAPWATFLILLRIGDKVLQEFECELSHEAIYWIQAAKLAAELVVKHRYYPAVERNEKQSLYSYWRMFAGRKEDQERFHTLCKGMPPACRAVFSSSFREDDLSCPDSKQILEGFMNWIIDPAVRNALLGENGYRLYMNLSRDEEKAWARSVGDDARVFTGLSALQRNSILDGYNRWVAPLYTSAGAQPFRTCFRITPPEAGEKKWKLDYFLQARDDLSLIVPAGEIWEKGGSISAFLNNKFDKPQDKLLEDLGTASRAFEPILKSLYLAKPTGCALSTEEAYKFLREGAVLLEESGFGIIAPSWWKKPAQISLKLKARVSGKSAGATASKGILNLDTLLEYDWTAALGDYQLSEDDFKKLAALKVPLVRVRGEWMQLDPAQIEKLEEMWKRKENEGTSRLRDILRMGLGHEELAPGIFVSRISGDRHFAEFIDKLSNMDKIEKLPTPVELRGELRPYQQRGFSWLAFMRKMGIGACLADDMGLGKTIQMISLLLFELYYDGAAQKEREVMERR